MRYHITLLMTAALLASCSNASKPEARTGWYKGDLKSFKEFSEKYHTGWPQPTELDYFPDKENKDIRYAVWRTTKTPRRGVVVHFNGRTEFIEKNIYTYQDLLARGYDVWTMDWRGQGLSKRRPTPDEPHDIAQRHNIDSFQTYVDDANKFLENKVKIQEEKGKKILLAHSMGGQIALRYLQKYQKEFDYAVLSSPLLRIPGEWYIKLGNTPKFLLHILRDKCVVSERPVWKSNFHDAKNGKNDSCELMAAPQTFDTYKAYPDEQPDKARTYSNDFKKLATIDCLIESSIGSTESGPDLRLACPTTRWLHEAFVSTELVMDNARSLQTPTLMINAEPDSKVDNDGQREFCDKANVSCVFIRTARSNASKPAPNQESIKSMQAGHELMIEVEPIRKTFFTLFDDFVAQETMP